MASASFNTMTLMYATRSKRTTRYCNASLVCTASSSTVATVSLPLAANQRTAGFARPMGVHMLYLTVASTDFTTNAWRLCWQPEPHSCRGQFPISDACTRLPLRFHTSPMTPRCEGKATWPQPAASAAAAAAAAAAQSTTCGLLAHMLELHSHMSGGSLWLRVI